MTTTELVPSSFEQMYEHYYTYVLQLTVRGGIDRQEAEDVAQTILTRFYERDALSDFDPEFTSVYDGVIRKATFSTFLSGFVTIYLRHHRERHIIRKSRELTLVDQPQNIKGDDLSVTWVEVNCEPHMDRVDTIEEIQMIREIQDRLDALPPKKAREKTDLSTFFRAVLEQAYGGDGVNVPKLAEQFNVTGTTIHNWMLRLRDEVQVVITS